MIELFENLIIFEMANSHQGSIEHGINIIKEMGKIANKYNVKIAIKLQYRHIDSFIHPDYKGRADVPHIQRFMETKLTYDQFCLLVEAIKAEGMIAMSTPFDETGVDWCVRQGLDVIKVASCSALDWPLLECIADTGKPVIVSVGGKDIAEIDKIYNFFTHRDIEFAIMHCIAEYPAPAERIQMDFIDKLRRRYPNVPIGYSGHEDPDDNIVPMLAVAKGVKILERHVGLPTDTIKLNSYSMNPAQAERWVESIIKAYSICQIQGDSRCIDKSERESLDSLMRGVFAKEDLKKGDKLSREKVFFAMPKIEGQMSSGEYLEGLDISRDYRAGEPLFEKRKVTNTTTIRKAIHKAKGLINEAGIALGNQFEVELSHHYGIRSFEQWGAVIISIINREYCKKLIVVLPGQQHPVHYHKIKEETFQLLYGDLEIDIAGQKRKMKPGDIQVVLRNDKHAFSSVKGAIFEEISTTHIKGDSYYEDFKIMKQDLIDRKTIVREW